MCAVSIVGQSWQQQQTQSTQEILRQLQLQQQIPSRQEILRQMPLQQQSQSYGAQYPNNLTVTHEEFNELKKSVEELKLQLIAAKKIDVANNEPDCTHEEKVALLKAVAKAVGVDLSEIFDK